MFIKELLLSQRKALLDLTYRNRLLSLPKRASAKAIVVHDERGDEVSRLLLRKTAMSFAAVRPGELEEDVTPEDVSLEADQHLLQPGDDEVDDRGVANRHSDNKLQSKLSSEHLQKRLLSIFVEAQTFQEEQGINALYLACGTLKYGEAESSDQFRLAPLLLIPVTLERKSAKDRFVLKWSEDEPQENLSLREKLKSEFGIKLPAFPDIDTLDYAAYMKDLADVVSDKKGWEVRPDDIQLGFFSFSKLLMFLDLDTEVWPATNAIANHKVVAGLLGNGMQCPAPPSLGEGQSLDQMIPVANMRHVVDCDSSQALVIESVRKGHDLVIQGPPGTGKSQTITNLIAMAITEGKKVLFLAEKAAALDVVHRRLTASNLGQACLVLHSKNANKRAVLEELGNTLALHKPAAVDLDKRIQQTQAFVDALNEHARRMHAPVGPAGFTPFQVFGELACRAEQPKTAPLRLPTAGTWTRDDWERLGTLVHDYARSARNLSPGTADRWAGTRHRPVMRLEAQDLFESIDRLTGMLDALRSDAYALGQALALPEPRSIDDCRQLVAIAEALQNAPEFDQSTVSATIWTAGAESLRKTLRTGQQAAELRTALAADVKDSALTMRWAEHKALIETHGRSLFRWFNSRYRSSLAEFRQHARKDDLGLDEQIRILQSLVDFEAAMSNLQSSAGQAAQALGSIWCGLDTNWRHACAVVEWVSAQHREPLGRKTLEVASNRGRATDAARLSGAVATHAESLHNALAALAETLNIDLPLVFGSDSVALCDLHRVRERVQTWRSDLDGFLSWTSHSQLLQRLRDAALQAPIDPLVSAGEPPDAVRAAFDLAFFQELARAVAAAHPELASFSGDAHSQLVARFAQQDRERLHLAQMESAAAHFHGMPSFASSDFGVLGRLKTEIAKKRSQMPVRKLMVECGTAVQAIKPVFMMSPLSVAQFLPPGRVEFDLLVIDEASQVEPIDALGAIARCKQVVVVGDDNQLPPTSFFSRAINDDPEESEDNLAQAKDVESILSLCSAKGIPMQRLRWHYRSKHESLIAVSNAEFYDHELFVVPSPDYRRAETGLKLHYIESGRFDRGGSGQNAEEAAAVVRAVLEHARRTPELSLGVTAMSIRQRDAILDLLEVERRKNPELEAFINQHPVEPFFVKNLESVQGDERDVIFISIGYGKAKGSDRLYGSFGPLNAEGGHRRLNVLITRAKLRCEVFTSLQSADIKTTESSARGVTALKAFLSYAETGSLHVPKQTGRGADSPFEEAVQKAIHRHGFDVHNQVGMSGFFIDLAVVDPEQPGRYLLGIECDGAAYHSSASARDRDRLRQQILESQGWRIHRIWSTDWFQRPQQQLDKVLAAIRQAKETGRRPQPPSVPLASPQLITVPTSPPASSAPARAEPPPSRDRASNPLSPAYVEASFPCPAPGLQPHEAPLGVIRELVVKIVEVEGPVHEEEVATRVRSCWGLARTGSRIVAAALAGLEAAKAQGRVESRDGFYAIPKKPVVVRDRANASSLTLRKPEMLPPTEIQAAIIKAAQETMGIPPADAVTLVARMLGFAATSRQLREIIEAQIAYLLTGTLLLESEGILVAPSAS